VERLAVEDLPPQKRRRSTPALRLFEREQPAELEPIGAAIPERQAPPLPAAQEPPPRDNELAVEVFRALARILSARALILLSVLGGFVIALVAALHESREVLFVFAAWSVLTTIPLIALELFRRE
jgi:hypothetical protein